MTGVKSLPKSWPWNQDLSPPFPVFSAQHSPFSCQSWENCTRAQSSMNVELSGTLRFVCSFLAPGIQAARFVFLLLFPTQNPAVCGTLAEQDWGLFCSYGQGARSQMAVLGLMGNASCQLFSSYKSLVFFLGKMLLRNSCQCMFSVSPIDGRHLLLHGTTMPVGGSLQVLPQFFPWERLRNVKQIGNTTRSHLWD